jgi:KUP system potassium uptake protein
MITGSFQLLAQVMRMSYFPHIKTVHTSKLFHGQVVSILILFDTCFVY